MNRLKAGLCAACLATVVGTGCHHPEPARARDRILVDSVHAHNALQAVTGPGSNDYHHVYGFRRAFGYLEREGLAHDEFTAGRLTLKQLRQYRMLFLNLVSTDLPPFLMSEVQAVRDYVRGGGGLLVITDHSNCYYHAHKLAPLLEPLGIVPTFETACDRSPHTLGPGNGWIAITRFARHPVTAELTCIAFQSGGAIDDRFAVAWTSPRAWGDLWQVNPYGEGNAPSLVGNWQQDPGERHGPLGTVLARTFGRGRIVIIGDQNLFADPFLHYADNYRLWLNTVAWLTHSPRLADAARYEAAAQSSITCYEDYRDAAFGDSSTGGYYHVFVALGRELSLFANNRLASDSGLIVFADARYTLAGETLQQVARHLRAGRKVLVLNHDPARLRAGTGLVADLLKTLDSVAPTREQGNTVYRWPSGGRLILLPDGDSVRNETFPPPEATLNSAEEMWLRRLADTCKEATGR